MQNKVRLFWSICSLFMMSCHTAHKNLDMEIFLLELAKDYRYFEGLANGAPIFSQRALDHSWINSDDIVIRFKSSQCLDCLIPIFNHISSLSFDEKSKIKLLATFDSEIQLKSFLRKHKVESLSYLNIDEGKISPKLELLPGSFIFRVSKDFTAVNVMILDKYFKDFNLNYLDGMLTLQNEKIP